MSHLWQYDDNIPIPNIPFISGDTDVPEELDLDDDEMKDLMEFSDEYGRQQRQSMMDADVQKTTSKVIQLVERETNKNGKELH